MSFSRLRTQVDTLMRKYAIELEAYRLRPLAQEFCDEMADSVTVNKDAPKLSLLEWTQVFAKRMISRGFRGQHLLDPPRLLEELPRPPGTPPGQRCTA